MSACLLIKRIVLKKNYMYSGVANCVSFLSNYVDDIDKRNDIL